MASKNKYNIIVGAKLDENSNLATQVQNAISKVSFKINIDTSYLQKQIQTALSKINVNVGGGGGGSGGTSSKGRPYSYYDSGGFTQTARGSAALFYEEEITHAKSVTKSLDEQGNAISRVVKGYDNAGHAIKQYYSIAKDESEVLVRSQREEGTLANKNAQTYERLSTRIKSLSANKQIATKRANELSQKLEDTNKLTDEFDKQNRFKEIGQDISDASKHTMTWAGMLKTAFDKFANFTPRIATSYRNVC